MIEINLLPKEFRKKKKRPEQTLKIPVIPIAIGTAGVLVITHVLLLFILANRENFLKTLESRWEQMQPQREKTEKISRQITALEKKAVAVREIAKPDLDWSELLTGLNQAVISNVWLSDFQLKFQGRRGKKQTIDDQPVSLDLTGFALGKSEVATNLVAKFINSLKKNKRFSIYFTEIELEDMRNIEIDGEEVMVFNIGCRFKAIESVLVKDKKRTENTDN